MVCLLEERQVSSQIFSRQTRLDRMDQLIRRKSDYNPPSRSSSQSSRWRSSNADVNCDGAKLRDIPLEEEAIIPINSKSSACWKIRVRIASARNVCDSEHCDSRPQFHCTGPFIPSIISAHFVYYFSFYSIQVV